MIRRPPRSTLDRSSAASDVYKRQVRIMVEPVMIMILLEKEELNFTIAGFIQLLLPNRITFHLHKVHSIRRELVRLPMNRV